MKQRKNHDLYSYQLCVAKAVGANNTTVKKVSAKIRKRELTTDPGKTAGRLEFLTKLFEIQCRLPGVL